MDEATELLQLEARRCDALLAADLDSLDLLFDDRLTWTHSSARQDTKASFLAGIQAGGTRYLTMKRMDEQVTVYETFAVITGVVEMRASIANEEKELRNRYHQRVAEDGRQLAHGRLAIDTRAF